MKKTFTVLAFFFIFLFSFKSYSQEIYFCEGVDDNGNPIGASKTFSIPYSGGSLYVLVKLNPATECSEVSYDVYQLIDNNESYYKTFSQNGLSSQWNWFWKSIRFDYAGKFRIYVNDCNGKILVKGDVKIKYD